MQDLTIDSNLLLPYFLILVLIIILAQRIFQKLLHYVVHNTNNLMIDDVSLTLSLGSKIFSGFLVIYISTIFFDFSNEILFGSAVIIGSIITLSSIQIINNIVSGLIIILFIKPYKVYDYVAISGMEGVVSEITLNYTKIKSIDGNFVLIPNRSILKSDITNFTIYKDKEALNKISNLQRFYDEIKAPILNQYSFQLSAPIETMNVHKFALNNVFDEFENKFGYRPKYFFLNLGQKIDYQIVIFALNSRTIRKNIKNFRTRLISELHSTSFQTDILK